ncbi:hypothetical protein NIES2134_112320 [Thermostichus vulcanus NIES-2134]|nr:hypothetical protein NIES2134_112320 [Thermostichus vulcanus NIES-2134]
MMPLKLAVLLKRCYGTPAPYLEDIRLMFERVPLLLSAARSAIADFDCQF